MTKFLLVIICHHKAFVHDKTIQTKLHSSTIFKIQTPALILLMINIEIKSKIRSYNCYMIEWPSCRPLYVLDIPLLWSGIVLLVLSPSAVNRSCQSWEDSCCRILDQLNRMKTETRHMHHLWEIPKQVLYKCFNTRIYRSINLRQETWTIVDSG